MISQEQDFTVDDREWKNSDEAIDTVTSGHIATGQVGIRGHSYDDEWTLTKHYMVEVRTPSGGWMGVKSFAEVDDAGAYMQELAYAGKYAHWVIHPVNDIRLFDNYAREVIA